MNTSCRFISFLCSCNESKRILYRTLHTPNGVHITSMSLQAMAGMKLLYRNREVLEKNLIIVEEKILFLYLIITMIPKSAPMPPSDWKRKCWLITDAPPKLKPVWQINAEAFERQKRKKISPISQKKRDRLKKEWTEKALFFSVWQSRADRHGRHWCEICGCEVKEPRAWCFSHNLSKWRYPEYRLFDKNITLVCSPECHQENDRRNKGRDQEFIKLFSKQH